MMRSIFLFSCLFASFTLIAQDDLFRKPVRLNFDQTPLQTVLKDITRQTGIAFSFDPSSVNVEQKVCVEIDRQTAEAALRSLLSRYNLSFRRNGVYAILQADFCASNNSSTKVSALKKIQAA